MNTITVGLSKIAAATCASVITAVGAWAFVSSTASTERDPFHFASVMIANAQARAGTLLTLNGAPTCSKESPVSTYLPSASQRVCRKG